MESEQEQWRREKADWTKEKLKIQELMRNAHPVVKLKVGATRIDVSRNVLTSVPDSLLARKFSGAHEFEKHQDVVFLDRDPEIFNLLLNHLRCNGRNEMLSDLDGYKLNQFEQELKYWQIPFAISSYQN